MLNDPIAAGIAIGFIAVLILMPFAFLVRDCLTRGTLNTSPFWYSTWAAVVFGLCLVALASYKPENRDVLSGLIYTLVIYVGAIGFFVLPFLLFVIVAYLFGYLLWWIGGVKRPSRADTALGKAEPADPKNAFGKRRKTPE